MGIGFVKGVKNLWELYKKRPNIKFDIGYATTQETSQEASSSLPKVTIKKDYTAVIITLTNIGYMPAELKELRAVIQGQDLLLQYSTVFSFGSIPVKRSYSGYSRNPIIRQQPGKFVTLNGGVYDYNSSDGPLKTLQPHKQHAIKVKNELFSSGIDDIYVTDTIGNKWSIDKKDLDSFMEEWNEARNNS